MRRALMLLVGLLLIPGCGGGSGDGAQGEAPTTTEAAGSAPKTQATETTQANEDTDTESTEAGEESPTGQTTEDLPFENGEGWFELDGERFEADFVVNCCPKARRESWW